MIIRTYNDYRTRICTIIIILRTCRHDLLSPAEIFEMSENSSVVIHIITKRVPKFEQYAIYVFRTIVLNRPLTLLTII